MEAWGRPSFFKTLSKNHWENLGAPPQELWQMIYIELFVIDSQKKYFQKLKECTYQKKTSPLFLNIIKFHQWLPNLQNGHVLKKSKCHSLKQQRIQGTTMTVCLLNVFSSSHKQKEWSHENLQTTKKWR